MASIRKRSWVYKGKERTAWVVDYFDAGRKRHIRTFSTRKEAVAYRIQAGHEVAQGVHTAPSTSLTVSEAYDLWLEHCVKEGLERSTIGPRRNHGDLAIKPFIGRVKLAELTMPRVTAFDDWLRETGRSVAMQRGILTSLKTMLTYAQGRGLVAQNVARGVRVKSDKRRSDAGPLRAGADFPTLSELKIMTDKAPDRWRPFVVTAIYTGMRASELRALRWDDVHFEGGLIHVTQRADAWGMMGPPKSRAGKRDIPLAPIVINTLRAWQLAFPKGALNLVFPTRRGTVANHQNIIGRCFNPLQVACGIMGDDGKPRYGFHALRHAAASLFIAHLGWTPKRLQAVMGHSSIAMTFDRYGHLFEDHEGDREAMKRIEAAIAVA